MRRPCERHYDADFVARAMSGELAPGDRAGFLEHARRCGECRRTMDLRAAARETWERAKSRDELTARASREQRLLSAASVQRTQRQAALRAAVLVAVIAAAALAFLVPRRPRTTGLPEAAVGSTVAPIESAPPPAQEQAKIPEAPVGKVAAAETCVSVMAARGPTRASGASLAAGASIAPGDLVTVQSGAALLLSWTLAGDDPSQGAQVDVSGPARMQMGQERGASVLVLDSGTARVTSSGPRVVRTAQAIMHAAKGEWTVAARARATYIDARAAKVVVDALSGRETILEPGQALWVPAEGVSLEPRLPGVLPETNVDGQWRAAQAAIARGDLSSAQAPLAEVIARSADAALCARAQLRLGEILLARGEVDVGRARLGPLISSADPSIGADAAFLYASSFRDPIARARAWQLYLSCRPPSPHYEDALLEDALAKLDGGDVDGARAVVEELRRRPLSPLTADGLRKLERRMPALDRRSPAVDPNDASPL